MDLITKLRYQGYANTPPLWINSVVSHFEQINLPLKPQNFNTSIVFKNQRLGKLVEEFVINQLQDREDISWICDNLQIQNGKQTIGEIDALYYVKNHPIHLEIVYKFYLYDSLKNYSDPLAYWIGPNRKDSLLYKLNKLHSKQFPLLYNKLTRPYLDTYNIDINIIKQHLCFKAQLFLPYQNNIIAVNPLNPNCIAGYYISFNKIELFLNHEFYIPKKLDWLVLPHANVTWISYKSVLELLETEIENQRSPLVWLKSASTELTKCFITFW